MHFQDDAKKRGLQQGISFHPDDPAGITLRIEFDHLDDGAEQASGVFFREEKWMEVIGILALFDAEVIDARSQQDKMQPDEDRAALSRPELEKTEVG